MKKLDKLILRSFLGPFILTFLVVVFILLTQYMLKYFDEFVGKDLGFEVFAKLLSYFAINMTPVAFPLAVLLSSLMTFGNLGEHFELTAIKSSGISLTRALLPIFVFTTLLTTLAFYSNNYIVPKANLKAFSLLYDIRQKKPSLDLKEGAFYNGIPGYSIKANKKFPDGITLKDLIIYDHRKGMGNTDVIIADSGKMFTIHNDRYLLLEMYKGNMYNQVVTNNRNVNYGEEPEGFYRTKFFKTKIVFSLASFDLQRTDEQLFATNRLMKNAEQLNVDIDSMRADAGEIMYGIYTNANKFFVFHLQEPFKSPEKYQPKPIKIAPYGYGEMRDPKVENSDSVQTYYRGVSKKNQTSKKPADSINAKPKVAVTPKIDGKKLPLRPGDENSKKSTALTKTKSPQQEKKNQVVVKDIQKSTSKTVLPTEEKEAVISNDSVDHTNLKNSFVYITSKNPKIKENHFVEITHRNIASRQRADSLKMAADSVKSAKFLLLDSAFNQPQNKVKALSLAVGQARFNKNHLMTQSVRLNHLLREARVYDIEKHKKYTQAAACLVMFLIGAPLGSIIKKGGLGVPVIVSILFFIIFYVASILGEKWGRENIIDPALGAWGANILLLPFGLFFLKQARNDARLFEADFYKVFYSKIKKKLGMEKPEEVLVQEVA